MTFRKAGSRSTVRTSPMCSRHRCAVRSRSFSRSRCCFIARWREHRVRAARCEPRRDRTRREARECARLYRGAAAGLRHAGWRARHQALGWRTSARRDCAGVSRRCADPDSGRSDLEPRQRKRSADPAGHGTADDGPHHAGGGAPPFHRASAGPAAGAGQGQGHRGRQSRGVDQTRERPVQAACSNVRRWS